MKPFNTEKFRVMFRAVYSVLVSVWAGAYLWQVTFSPAKEVSKHAEFIIGFILGTLIATVVGFYYGGNDAKTPETVGPADFSTHGQPLSGVSYATDEISGPNDTEGKSHVDA